MDRGRCQPSFAGSLTAYPGGTGLWSKLLRKYDPPHYTTYCEPFAGLGSRYWEHPLCGIDKVVIGDLDPLTIAIWKGIEDGTLAGKIRAAGCLRVTPDNLKSWTTSKDPVKRMALWKTAFLGVDMVPGRTPHVRTKDVNTCASFKRMLDRLPLAQAKLSSSNTTIRKSDYKATIRAVDSPSTFFFIDPPWSHASARRFYTTDQVDWKELLDVLKKVKGKFMVYNVWDDQVSENALARGFNVTRFMSRRRKDADKRATNHIDGYMMITNYTIPSNPNSQAGLEGIGVAQVIKGVSGIFGLGTGKQVWNWISNVAEFFT